MIMNEMLSQLSHCLLPYLVQLIQFMKTSLFLFQDSRDQQRDEKILQFILLFKKAAFEVVNFVSFASLCFVVSVPLLQLQLKISPSTNLASLGSIAAYNRI